ncbi:pyridoxal phosphate-dependent aminotransferase [Chloroflexota bacterium]
MSLRPRPEVDNLEVGLHGGPDVAELKAMGLTPESVLDFSVCANPFPPPSGVRAVLNTIAVNQYPDSQSTEYRQYLAVKLGVTADNILAGSGTTELIRLIALTYFGHGDSVLILEPTFGEYRVATQIVGAEILGQRGQEGDNFTLKVDDTISFIRRHHPRGVFICNPNNPTGQYFSRGEVEGILDACRDGLLILDEAYISFVDGSWPSIDLIDHGNLVILRSLTKDYALAGLRLGYVVAGEEIIDALRRVCPPWNVNVVAQQAGIAALNDRDYLEPCQREIAEAKRFLVAGIENIGFNTIPSRAHFFLVRVNNAKGFRAALLKQGILVRDCTSFGLPEYVRISARTMPECQRLINTIQELKYQGGLK